jgi:hypothetical protein
MVRIRVRDRVRVRVRLRDGVRDRVRVGDSDKIRVRVRVVGTGLLFRHADASVAALDFHKTLDIVGLRDRIMGRVRSRVRVRVEGG